MDPNNVGRSFRESPWRYSQFVVVGLIVTVVARWVSDVSWLIALAIGAVGGIGYWFLEKKRGVI